MKHLNSLIRGSLPLFFVLVVASPALAQQPGEEAGDEPDIEVEIEVESEPAEPARPDETSPAQSASEPSEQRAPSQPAPSQPAPAPSPALRPAEQGATEGRATAEPAAEPTRAVDADGGGSFSVPSARSPVGESSLPRSLVAEGSNYTRPMRLGLSWWGFVQAEYYDNQISENQLDPDGRPLNQDQFGVRRGRLRIDHGWEYAFATFELDVGTFGGPNVRLRRAEASLLYRAGVSDDITPPFVLTAGVIDLPFGGEIGESQRDRLFVERSLGSVALFPSLADGGIKLWGAYRFVNYAVALVNGEPAGNAGIPVDRDSHKDVVGRIGVAASPSDTILVTGGLSFYVGKGLSPGTLATKDTITWVDFDNNGVVDSGEIQGVTGSTAFPSRDFERWAIGFDAATSLQHPLGVLQLATEAFYASNLDRGVLPLDPIVSGASSRQLGLMVSLVQQVTEWGAIGFRAAYYDPNSNLLEQRAGVFHLKDQSFLVFSPVVALTLAHGRIAAQYDIVRDHMGRDRRGVPADVRNNQFTLRLQVDL